METIISGADVPTETMVKPTTNEEMPNDLAKLALPATNLSAPQIRPSIPATRAQMGEYNDIIRFFLSTS